MPPFGGQLPPTMMGAPPGAGPAVAPHGNPGQTTQGLAGVKIALEALQKALPAIPMGTELHTAIIDSIKKIGAHMTDMQDSPQMKMQELLHMIAAQRSAQPNAALAGIAGGGMKPPGMPGAPPMPPMIGPPPNAPPMAA